MAFPIGHLYLALQVLAGPLKHFDETAFVVGANFPDIRNGAHIARNITHKHPVSWSDVVHAADAFTAGAYFHAYVDEAHDAYFKQCSDLVLNSRTHVSSLKVAEDILLYPKITYKRVIPFFDHIFDQERAIVSKEKVIMRWHEQLQEYFLHGPTREGLEALLDGMCSHFKAKLGAPYLLAHAKTFLQNPDVVKHINHFYTTFVEQFAHNTYLSENVACALV